MQIKSDLGVYDINNIYSVFIDLWNGESVVYYLIFICGVVVKFLVMCFYEIGMVIYMFKNCLKLDFIYYNKFYYNLICSVGISNFFGFMFILINIDEEYVGWGVELILLGDIIRMRDLKWELFFNWLCDCWYYIKIDLVYFI